MQSYTEIPDSLTLSESRSLLLNNDRTVLSNSSGTEFPTENLEVGMLCVRVDETPKKIYVLRAINAGVSDWFCIATLDESYSDRLIKDIGTINSGEIAAFSYAVSDSYTVTFSGGIATIALSDFVPGRRCVMMICLKNAGLATLNFPSINWVVPDGTYTTNIATYLTAIGRASFSTTQPTWMFVWSNDGVSYYGKIL